MIIEKSVCMKPYSNMRIGGIAKELIHIENKNELQEIYDTRDRIYLIGNGTNTLINDSYLDISFVSLKKLNKITIEKDNGDSVLVRAEAGVDFLDFIHFMEKHDLSGIENMTGIPGSFGGITNMNAGAYGTEIFDYIESVEVFDKSFGVKSLDKNQLDSRYRGTAIKDNAWVVVSTLLKLNKGFDKEASQDKIAKRKNNHPLDFPNLGSTFKNPEGNFAAQLISDCGLKGHMEGKMQISEKHPNFLINHGDAKFEDVLKLIDFIKKEVNKQTGVSLNTEIIILDK